MGVATKSTVRNATPTVIFSIFANGERTFPVKVRQTPIMAVRVSHGFPAFPRSSFHFLICILPESVAERSG